MNVKKFFANSSRQALQMVRQRLGPDALILSNRPIEGGVEILAMPHDQVLQEDPHEEAVPSATARAATAAAKPAVAVPADALAEPARLDDVAPAPLATAALAPASGAEPDLAKAGLLSEMQSMRKLIEEHLVFQTLDLAQRRDPDRVRVLRGMLHAGFSAALARQFLAKMPEGLTLEQKLNWVRSGLDRNLRTAETLDEVVERGGIFALVGPTGVGKTTTVAKIAARCVVRFGAERITLLTTDGYRIGAQEQLRIYGKLLGVRVVSIKDATDLQLALEDLHGKHLVLIDTVGMSQRDQMVTEQLEMLCAPVAKVQRLLLLNATSSGETLDDVVRVYGKGARGCILTKTDEAVGIATALDVVIRHQLPLHYVTDGQRVPEDLHMPDRAQLLQRAMRPIRVPTAHHLDSDQTQLMLAGVPAAPVAAGLSLA